MICTSLNNMDTNQAARCWKKLVSVRAAIESQPKLGLDSNSLLTR
jgi:hypothetical protein